MLVLKTDRKDVYQKPDHNDILTCTDYRYLQKSVLLKVAHVINEIMKIC